jgi:hypothetical protein
MSRGARRLLLAALALAALAAAVRGAAALLAMRVYVPPGHMLVLSAFRDGGEPARVLGPGRYVVNPLREGHAVHPMVHVPAGKVGVVVSGIGAPLADGGFLAEPGQRGIQRRVLTPGRYLLDPATHPVTLHDATVIRAGFVGVVTRLAGANTQEELALAGQRGVQRDVLPPGLYHLNPYEVSVTPVKIGFHELTFEAADAIAFPASDSNTIRVDATIVWGLNPSDAPLVIKRFGSEAEIVERLIRPQCESVMRLAGSNYKAREFIEGESRRRFQEAVEQNLKEALGDKDVRVLLALIRRIEIPDEVRKWVQNTRISQETALTYEVKAETADILRQLNEVKGRVQLEATRAAGETARLVDEEKQRGKGTVGAIQAQAMVDELALRVQARAIETEIERALGAAGAEAVRIEGEAAAEGERLRIVAFGDPEAFRLFLFASRLKDDLTVELRDGAAELQDLLAGLSQ